MEVLKRLKIKLYPTFKQKDVLENHFNAYRFCYNLCLEYKISLWKHHKLRVSAYDMQKQLVDVRKNLVWLNRCKSECLRESAVNVDLAFSNFFKGNGYPKFKSKKSPQSFTSKQNTIIIGSKIKFFGNSIRFRTSDEYLDKLSKSSIKQVTFKKDTCGGYWASILIKEEKEVIPNIIKNVIGIDLGIKDLLITSNGDIYPNNRFLIKNLKNLSIMHRRLSKKQKESKNKEKSKEKLSKLYRKISHQREHYLHQVSNSIIRDNQTIITESLKISNMVKNRKLSKSINDFSWGVLISMLEYKSKWNGREMIKIGRFVPSSKTCSGCGNVKTNLLLSERIYNCECCGLSIDRDLNAAINIRDAGLKIPEVPMEDTKYGSYEVGSNSIILNN